jgi:hypothetical protein
MSENPKKDPRKSYRDVELRDWQKSVIAAIDSQDEFRDSEQYQGLSEYAVNKSLGVTAVFPRYSGHTYLANYIAHKYPTLLIYTNMDHFRKLTQLFPLHEGTETVSVYEMFYAVYKPTKHQPSPEFLELKKKFSGKKVVVVDNAQSLLVDMQDLLYNNAQCCVVMLGH